MAALRHFQEGVISETAAVAAAAAVPGALASAEAAAKAATKASAAAALEAAGAEGAEGAEDAEGADRADEEQEEYDAEGTEADGGEVVTELLSWGRASNYQLGFGALGQEQLVPRPVPLPPRIAVHSLACGRFHSVAIATSGAVLSWGVGGTTGRLGIESGNAAATVIVEPTLLPEFGPTRHVAKKAAVGLDHSLVVTVAGKLLAWGSNSHGQLGALSAIGPGVQSCRPLVLKACLKGEDVVDVAAGAAHSLCCTSSGRVFSWGSNAGGALGLGAPPQGPAESGSPQQLPHIRGAYAVAASASSNVSLVLAGHGDAMLFGSPTAPATQSGGTAFSAASAAGVPAVHYVPTRVRRRERKAATGGCAFASFAHGSANLEEEEWQTQRSCGPGTSTGVPLENVAIGAEEAFAVDAEGTLWVFPLSGSRPCSADAVVTRRNAVGPQAFACVAVAERLGVVWALDRSRCACLWRLRRAGDAWKAERSEHIAQVRLVACSPEHQAAIVAYRRPALPSVPAVEPSAGRPEADAEDEDAETDSWPPAVEATLLEVPATGRRRPPSLQQLCEDALCRKLTPHSFGTLIDVAWDFNRPNLLDRAFAFLRTNAALMFSRQHLPTLAQLPREVIGAFELVARGQFQSVEDALEAGDAPLPPPEAFALPPPSSPALGPSFGASPSEHRSNAAASRRRRRGGSGGGGQQNEQLSPDATPTSSPAAAPASPPFAVATSLAGACGGAAPVAVSALAAGAPTAPVVLGRQQQPSSGDAKDWVKVAPIRRKASGTAASYCASPVLAPAVANSAPYVATAPLGRPPSTVSGCGAGAAGVAGAAGGDEEASRAAPPSSPKQEPRPSFKLADFLVPARTQRPRGAGALKAAGAPKTASALKEASAAPWGLSAALVVAVRSAAAKAEAATLAGERTTSPWVAPSEAPASLREILAAEDATLPRPHAASNFDVEATRNSWGFEAMPSERQRGASVYHIQQQEREERARKDEETEMLEIEAMFFALEVADQADFLEHVDTTDCDRRALDALAPSVSSAAEREGAERGRAEREGEPPREAGGNNTSCGGGGGGGRHRRQDQARERKRERASTDKFDGGDRISLFFAAALHVGASRLNADALSHHESGRCRLEWLFFLVGRRRLGHLAGL